MKILLNDTLNESENCQLNLSNMTASTSSQTIDLSSNQSALESLNSSSGLNAHDLSCNRKRKSNDSDEIDFNQSDNQPTGGLLIWKKKRAALQLQAKEKTPELEQPEADQSSWESNRFAERQSTANQESHSSTEPHSETSFLRSLDSSDRYFMTSTEEADIQMMGALALIELATQTPFEIGSEVDITSDQLVSRGIPASDEAVKLQNADEIHFNTSQGDYSALNNQKCFFSSRTLFTPDNISSDQNLLTCL